MIHLQHGPSISMDSKYRVIKRLYCTCHFNVAVSDPEGVQVPFYGSKIMRHRETALYLSF